MQHRVPRLGLSTSCFGTRYASFREQAEAARGLGFESVEIGLSDSPPSWDGAAKALEEFGVRAPALRAGCRETARGAYRPGEELASLDDAARRGAVRSVLDDIALAKKTSSPILALSAGFVGVPGIAERIKTLASHIRQGRERETGEMKEEIRLATAPTRVKHLDRACRSLFEISRKEPEIALAIETPRDPHFLPTPEELEQIFEDLPGVRLGYAHDTGAAAWIEAFSGISQAVWLERFVGRLFVLRAHDVVGLEQRRPPGTGEIDWKLVGGYLPRSAQRFLDIDSQHGPDGLRGAVRFLEKYGF